MLHSVDECSPKGFESHAQTGSCLNSKDLKVIAKSMQVKYETREGLKNKFVGCEGESSDTCLLEAIGTRGKKKYKDIRAKFRTKKPFTWTRPGMDHAWLTNKDIDNVMRQYSDEKFVYMGSMPRDFASLRHNGSCVKKGMCDFDPIVLQHKSFGFVFNLDVHTGTGTHWTAMYGSADPNNVKYGVFFFCSYGKPPSDAVKLLMDIIVKWLKATNPGKTPNKGFNQTRFQQKNTECGVFSCAFLIRCKEHQSESYTDALKTMGDDDMIFLLRNVLFRT